MAYIQTASVTSNDIENARAGDPQYVSHTGNDDMNITITQFYTPHIHIPFIPKHLEGFVQLSCEYIV